MKTILKPLEHKHLQQATDLWNEIVAHPGSFPGDALLTAQQAQEMFAAQTATFCAFRSEEMTGLYILHPNNIGRCGHIANASYAVKSTSRGQGVGRLLVEDSIRQAKAHGFRGLQFNAVVASNHRAIALYLKLGFKIIGTIHQGYRMGENQYEDTLIFLKSW